MSIDLNRAISVKQQNLNHLITRRNVVGVGIGYKESGGEITDELAVVVNVTKKIPKAQLAESDKAPAQLDGVKTDVVETGHFLAGGLSPGTSTQDIVIQTRGVKDRWRPVIPAGTSLGHIAITAGTFGCLVKRGRTLFILSNNHVLANVNNSQPGDPIIQPARYDGGSLDDKVATLADYVSLDFGGEASQSKLVTGIEKFLNWLSGLVGSDHRFLSYRTSPGQNLVDAALARPLDPNQFSPDILNIGRPKGVRQATLGTKLQKTGRTTGYTQGSIRQIEVTISVDYNGRAATFTGQLIANGMSLGGDSGSAVLDDEGYLVGLLFAGSTSASLINPIQTVLDLLKVEVVI